MTANVVEPRPAAVAPPAPPAPAVPAIAAGDGRRCEDCGQRLHPRRKGEKCKACRRKRFCAFCGAEIGRGKYCDDGHKVAAAERLLREKQEAAALDLVEPLVAAVGTGGVTQPIARLRAQLVDTRSKEGRERFTAALALAVRGGRVALIGERAFPSAWLGRGGSAP